MIRLPPISTLPGPPFPYRTLFRSGFAVQDEAVEAGQQDVHDQRIDLAHVTVEQAQFGEPRQLVAQVLGRLRQLLQQQALQRATMLPLGLGLGDRKSTRLNSSN